MNRFREYARHTQSPGYAIRVFQEKARLDKTSKVWFDYSENLSLSAEDWELAFKILNDKEVNNLWTALTGSTGGSRAQNWFPASLNALKAGFTSVHSVMIPAIRQIGKQGSVSEEFSGEGIIERLVRLQNPDVHSQSDRLKFKNINLFLRSVTDNQTARIEIPHERDTILVHMDGKTLPLECLGTGIHEVIILASAATVLEDTVICMEEPELHLNPLLQKKLVRYLLDSTNNQYFITTHSAALTDTPSAEVYHLKMLNGQSLVERVTSDKQRSAVCEDLGYHPSDLLQSNCIIWVEGPSDRIYLNYWLKATEPRYIEGIHYSIMFYGGRLLSHLSGGDLHDYVEDFISLRRLNRRGVIVIDSDKDNKGSRINNTKKRLQSEFDMGPGFSWVTDGREIENYIDPDAIKEAISNSTPSAVVLSDFGQYANPLTIKSKSGKITQASKVEVARYVTQNFVADVARLDLQKRLRRLAAFIGESNPGLHIK